MAISTKASQWTISGNSFTLPTKHTSILLLRLKVIFSERRDIVQIQRISRKEERRQG
jgi:hypothetical protein